MKDFLEQFKKNHKNLSADNVRLIDQIIREYEEYAHRLPVVKKKMINIEQFEKLANKVKRSFDYEKTYGGKVQPDKESN